MSDKYHIIWMDLEIDSNEEVRVTALSDDRASMIGVVSLKNAGKPAATLFQLFVEPSRRLKGIGEALVRACVEIAAVRGSTVLSAIVTEDGPIEFYEKLGFRPVHLENGNTLMAAAIAKSS